MTRRPSTLAVIFGAALASGACAAPPASAPAATSAATSAAAASPIAEEAMRARIAFLASDAMRGRDTPSPELEAAARYLADEARSLGLEPAGDDGTYLQRWPFPSRRLDLGATRLTVSGPRGTETFRWGTDFFALGGTDGEVRAGVVFAGREIPTDGGAALRDRVVVVMLPGSANQQWQQLRNRQIAQARQQGARAVIHVVDRDFPPAQMTSLAGRLVQPARVLGEAAGYPSLVVSHAAAERLFRSAGLSWEAAAAASAPVALAGVTLTAAAPVEVLDDARPPNVVAVLRGSDPVLRDEYVILSAHFDHVGVGRPIDGDSIYNGADDNASGTAGLLEVARAMAALPQRPRRSVAFLWVSGEEKGLLGSRWYADNPTLPIERLVANINVDMIGGDRHRDTVVVIGKTYSTLGEVVNRTHARLPELNLVASDDIWPEQRFFFRSDHFNFARREVPAIFFFTGVHECYHRPCDTVDFVDAGKAARVANLIFHTTLEIANADRRPVWDPAGLEEVRSLTR